MREPSEEMGQERGSERPPIAAVLTTSRNDTVVASKRSDLDDQLTALQGDAADQYPDYRRRHERLWRLLSKTYLWWREASQEGDYLEAQYKEKGIRYRSDGDRPNFNPLIRLVWGIEDVEAADRVTISQWNQALQAMHALYLRKPEDFNHNPEGKLTALLQAQGGVAGLAAASPGTADKTDHDRAHSPKTKPRAGASDARVTAEISRQALAQVNAFTEIAAFTTEHPIRVGADGFLVLLARRGQTGRINIVGSSNDPAQIEAVATTIARRDVANVTPSLRALVQIIATQAFPAHALPSSREQRAKWYRRRYAEPGDLHLSDLEGFEGDERGQSLRSWKRLLLRGSREAVLSGSVITVSPVTRCVLAEPLIDEGDAVFLRAHDLAAIEQWYAGGELALLRATRSSGYRESIYSKRSRYPEPKEYHAMSRTALVLFSGGQDSTTCLAWALSRFDHVETIGFDYRQRHRVELDCRATVLAALKRLFPDWASRLGEDRVIDLGMIRDLGETALASDVEIQMRANGLPNTFVPGRNILFLTTAGAVAYRRGIKYLIGGMCETDFSGYPDCRDDVKALQATLNLAMESRLVIETPLMWLDKAATWRLADELGGDLLVDLIRLDTHTCYHGDRQHSHDWGYGCGKCPACDLRKVGYEKFRSSSVRRSPVGDPDPRSQIRPWRYSSREP